MVINMNKNDLEFYGSNMLYYESALIELVSRLDIIRKYLLNKKGRDPIENIKTRIKSADSMIATLTLHGLEPVVESINGNIYDTAGARVICTYVDDVYEVARILRSHDDIEVIEEKDYIKHPKPSGYRSYHMIVKLPIYIGDEYKQVFTEIQIRTLSMDFWASLEHKIRYKHDVPNQAIVASELKRCADEVASIEMNFITIRDMIKAITGEDHETKNT